MNPSPPTSLKLNRQALSGSLQATRYFLQRQLWVWPVLAAIVVGVAAWVVNHEVEAAIRQDMHDDMITLLDSEIKAMGIWIKEQEINVQLLAISEPVLPAVQALSQLDDPSREAMLKAPALAELRAFFAKRLPIIQLANRQGVSFSDFFVISPQHRILASNRDDAVGLDLKAFNWPAFDQAMQGRALVSKPMPSIMPLPDPTGALRVGQPTMFALGPIRDGERSIAILALRMRPEEEFTQILQAARPGRTGETYAFDRQGLFLSESRFDDDLRRLGLMPDIAGAHSVLTVELRDPGVNMLEGKRPAQKRSEQPLTRMAADAVQGHSGVDIDGYRDYRGVPTVGAWQWVPELDFGVATEMDYDEAYKPMSVLRKAFGGLIGLLALSAVAIFVCMLVVARNQRDLQKMAQAAEQLGQYTLKEQIGAGGMGSVYRAEHRFLRRKTAVKILDLAKCGADGYARFEREVQLTSELTHPNTISVYDYGKADDGRFFYAMEFLDGLSLEDLVKIGGPQPEGRVIYILQQVCRSLAEAHERGLIHRDIKPANIMLTARGGEPDFVKVLDFGLARSVAEGDVRLTSQNTVLGTPLYMAPESIERPESVDARADIYAIGGVGYFLLTATPMFSGDTVMAVCMAHIEKEPEPPSVRVGRPITPELEAIMLWCLSKKHTERPVTARELADELAKCPVAASWTRADAEAWWRARKPGTTVVAASPSTATKGETLARTLPAGPPS